MTFSSAEQPAGPRHASNPGTDPSLDQKESEPLGKAGPSNFATHCVSDLWRPVVPPCKRRAGRPVLPSGRERMTAPPLTRASLLVRLRDPDDGDAWKEFVRLYASVIYGFARKRGLQDADA